MSVYSGFATRKQETYYNKLLSKLISILTHHILALPADPSHFPKFGGCLHKIYKYMCLMENYKYMEPHYSKLINPLVDRY